MHSHWPARTPAAMAGSLKFPAFLLFWSLGLLLAAGAVLPADALVRKAPLSIVALSTLPTLEDREDFGAALETELRESAVVSGAWQPPVEVAAPVAVPMSPPELAPQLTLRSPAAPEQRPRVDVVGEPAQIRVRTSPAARGPAGRAPVLEAAASRALEGGQRALEEGRFAAAYRLLMGEVEHAASSPAYLGALAVSALALGRDAEALLLYERLTQLAPDDGRWWAGAALSRERLGLEASAQFEAVAELAGDDETLHTLATSRLRDLG